MNTTDLTKAGKSTLASEIATRSTDPNFYGALTVLPNPDPVLRKLGRADDAYDGIASDAHVIGELRTIRAALTGWEWRLEASGDTPADMRALELCEQVMARRPAPGLTWADTIWSMAQAVFRGRAVHEVTWARLDRLLLLDRVLYRPLRRFVFGTDNDLRLLTRNDPSRGVELGEYKWLLSRHMPSAENPYGVALFGSCFWPYTFKHSGFRYFVKFCEKYGIPWAIGRYPVGTPKEQQDELARALAAMIEDAVAAVQEGAGVELLEAKHGGQLVHERLIDVCNREMSKALTSQTLATENQTGGSQAAATIHRERETAVNESDRQIIVDTMNTLLGWITEINVPGAAAPTFEFYDEAQAREDWVKVLKDARHFVQVPKWFAHERLQIPQPTAEEIAQGDLLPGFGEAPTGPGGLNFSRSQGCACCGGEHEFAAGRDDQAAVDALGNALSGELQPIAEQMFQPLLDALADGMTPEDLSIRIGEWYPKLDDAALEDLLARAILVADLHGRLAAQRDANDG